jgi:two-component system, sensor histidine kinase LadS
MTLKQWRQRGWGILLIAMMALPAVARTVLDLDTSRQPVALQDWGDAWIDDQGLATPDTVSAGEGIAWQPTRNGAIYPLKPGKALWFRFTIPPAPDAEHWYLEIPYPSVDRVVLYSRDSTGKWLGQEAGDSLPVAHWPMPHRHPLLPMQVSAEEPRHYLVRVENPHSFSAPLLFVSERHLSRGEQRTSLILGMFFGLAGLAVVLAILTAISLRDGAYGFFALSVALMAMSQVSMTGIGGLHLWPHQPWWNDLSPMMLPVLAVGSLMWFFSAVVSMPDRSATLHRVLTGMALLSVAAGLGLVVIEPEHRFQLMVGYILAAITVGVLSVLWAARRGDRYALWLMLGTVPVIVGSLFPLARLSGLIPVSFWTMYGLQVGIAIELPFLLIVLLMRSQQRREHHRRIQGLDRIDPNTGLINAVVFAERLTRMMARSRRLNYESAVLLVDIVNIEQIRRDFGARSAEELPLRVAGRLLSITREIDEVGRLSGLRFGMLVEGPLTPEEAASMGPRMVARCLMPFKDKPVEWVAQVRIAQSLVPVDPPDAKELIAKLEAVLAGVDPDSRRAVYTLRA